MRRPIVRPCALMPNRAAGRELRAGFHLSRQTSLAAPGHERRRYGARNLIVNLHQLGWNPQYQSDFANLVAAGGARRCDKPGPPGQSLLVPGRAARQDRDSYVVYVAASPGHVESAPVRALRASLRGALRHDALSAPDLPAVGDWVVVQTSPCLAAGRIEAILPRRSCLTRKAAGPGAADQVLAANVDCLLVCCGLDGDFNLRRIERYLTLAHGCGVMPVVLLSKADLCDDVPARVAQVQAIALDATVIAVSAVDGRGLPALRSWLPAGQSAVLAGSSGVGKSTLINCLLGREQMRTRAVREHDSRGRHTTTYRQLLLVPGGGVIIDTPGMRELALLDDAADVDRSFADIADFARNCRFRDCTHECEPGCRVRAAVESGELPAGRLESYFRQLRELAHELRKSDPAARAAEVARWKALHRSARKWMQRKYGNEID